MSTHLTIHLLTGMVGSGKTLFLRRLLERGVIQGRLAIIVNDFGDMVYDALLLRQSLRLQDSLHNNNPAQQNAEKLASPPDIQILDVPGGCLCCSATEDFKTAFQTLIECGVEHVFIEATGLADAEQVRYDIAYMGYPVDGVWCVVDALNFSTLRTRYAVVEQQIQAADIVLFSKTDLLPTASSETFLTALHAEITALNTRAQLIILKNGSAPASLFVPHIAPPEHFVPEFAEHHHQLHLLRDSIQACLVHFHSLIETEILCTIMRQLPPDIVRGKGMIIDQTTRQQQLVYYVCGRIEIHAQLPQDQEHGASHTHAPHREQQTEEKKKSFGELLLLGQNIEAQTMHELFAVLAATIRIGTVRGLWS